MSRKRILVVTSIIVIVIVALVAYYSFFIRPGPASPIVIGVALPFSPPGDYKAGSLMLEAIKMAVEEINQAGGVLGRNLTVKWEDTKGLPEEGVAAVERLITLDGANVVIGAWHSSVSNAINDICEKYNIINIQAASWANEITAEHFKTTFRIAQYNDEIAQRIIVPFLRDYGFKNVAILAESTDFGMGVADAVKKEIERLGLNITVHVITYETGSSDLSPWLLNIKAITPPVQIVINSASGYPNTYLVHKQAWETGLCPSAMILGSWDYPALPDFWEINKQYGVGALYAAFEHPAFPLPPRAQEFARRFKERTGVEVPYYAYLHYDAVYLYAEAVKKAGTTNTDEVIKILENIKFEGTLGTISFETSPEPGPVWHQWTGHPAFVCQLTAVNQPASNSTIVWPKEYATGELKWPP